MLVDYPHASPSAVSHQREIANRTLALHAWKPSVGTNFRRLSWINSQLGAQILQFRPSEPGQRSWSR